MPVTGEKRVRARYVYVPDSEKEARHAFGTARDEILSVVAEKLPPIDAPLKKQASELTVLLDALLWCRKKLLADLLRDALRQPKDEDAIHYFIGRTSYITECADDHMLLALLDRRDAAPRALDIWLGHCPPEEGKSSRAPGARHKRPRKSARARDRGTSLSSDGPLGETGPGGRTWLE